eukprot:scaffold2717_cov180-Alexandrium_tamarense.AAC.1
MGLNGVMPFQPDECLTSLNNQHNNQHPEFAQCFPTAIHVKRTILPKPLWRGATAALLIYLNWNAIILGNVLSDSSGEAIAFSSSTTATNPIHLIRNTQLQSGRANAEPEFRLGKKDQLLKARHTAGSIT